MTTDQHKEIKAVILALYNSYEQSNPSLFKSIIHSQVRTINIGNNNQIHIFSADEIIENTILGLKRAKEQIPGFYAKWVNINFISLTIHDLIASIEITYTMKMPDSYGNHSTFIQLAKENTKWLIINIIDRGLEFPN